MEKEYSSLSIFLLLLFSPLLLLVNIPHCHSLSPSFNGKCHEEEKNALLEFKATFFNQTCVPGSRWYSQKEMVDLKTWEREGKNGDCCNWDGIKCDNHTGHVIRLNLTDSCFSGSINSSTTIFKLDHLQVLDLSFNDFHYSKIPSTISNLSQLEGLFLFDSNLSGQIPLEILNLTNLAFLGFSGHQLTLKNPSLRDLVQSLVKLVELSLVDMEISSSIPDSLSKLTSLRYLILYDCELQGQVPPSLSNLTKLEDLYLSYNHLTGEIFPQLVGLTKLQNVELSYNNFSGQIPRTISHLKNLTYLFLRSNNFSKETHLDSIFQLDRLEKLDLSTNNFSWVIDSSIKPTSKLQYLHLSSCNLRSFPLFLQSQNRLEKLDLSYNDIFGDIPTWICDLDNLTLLSLRNNNLIGKIPQCLIGMNGAKNLNNLDLSYNHLSGFEGNLPLLKLSLEYLDLRFNHLKVSLPISSISSSISYYLVSNNQFFGELPMKMCDLVNLRIFDISNNNLSGVVPQCLAHLVGIGNLSVLNMHNNNFNGLIPQLGKTRCNLMMIDVGHNQLEGPMPRDMENCQNLEFFNLENNKIDDVFPFWLGKLPSLSILILRSNRFHGIIGKPSSGYKFPKLQIIDLSNNNFIGYLPAQYFDGWNAMKVDAHREDQTVSYASYGSSSYFYTVTMSNKGTYREYTRIPESLIGVDLSSNRFMGVIPKSLPTLKGLRFLHVSNNMLTGSIPWKLSGLTNLESLDLSHNELCGEIPQQLTDLTTLEFFDVSFNQLTGPIPQSNQFITFGSSSYQGNQGLCGPPLVRQCGNIFEASPQPSLERNRASRSWIEIEWKIVSMGYTSGFVIGVVVGMTWTRGCKRVKSVYQIKFLLN